MKSPLSELFPAWAFSILVGLSGCDQTDGGHGQTESAQVEVALDTGRLVGFSQDGVDAFLGVPYAAPPVGALRWHPPQPATALTGDRDATQPASACPQGESIAGPDDPSDDEDCLYLNIYRPSTSQPPAPFPVMVWIHGGSSTSGSG